MKIMPLGDSLTYGVVNNRVTPQNSKLGGYRTFLWDSLQSDGFSVDFVGPLTNNAGDIESIDKHHAGFSGWRIDQLLNGRTSGTTFGIDNTSLGNINDWLEAEKPDIVLLMAGTNDILQENKNKPVQKAAESARDDLRELIQTIHDAGAQVLFSSIPAIDPGAPEALKSATENRAAMVDVFNALLPKLAAEFPADVRFVDIASTLDGVKALSKDGVHLTSVAYSKVATAWHNALLPTLAPNQFQPETVARNTPIRMEAESFSQLENFALEQPSKLPSAINVISLFQQTIPATGTASTTLTLPTGHYDITIGYFDEPDGVGSIEVSIGNQSITNFSLDGNFGNNDDVTPQSFVHKTIAKNLAITQDDDIKITGISNGIDAGGEQIRIDYIEFTPILIPTEPDSSDDPDDSDGNSNSSGDNTDSSTDSGNLNGINDSSGGNENGTEPDTEGLLGVPLKKPNFRKGKKGERIKGDGDRNRLTGTGRNDTLVGKGDNDVIKAKGGNDKVKGNDGRDKLAGQGGSDRLIGGDDNDKIKGGGGRDLLKGQDGRDRLIGQRGDDILIGGDDRDKLTGNGGKDVFTFKKLSGSMDVITDFKVGKDLIDLRNIFNAPAFEAVTPFSKYQNFVRLTQRGNATIIQIDANGNAPGDELESIAKLKNVSVAEVQSSDFLA